MLFAAWAADPLRPTKDVDLLGFGESAIPAVAERSGPPAGRRSTTMHCGSIGRRSRPAPSAGPRSIRESGSAWTAFLGKVRIPVQIDIGFGDVITSAAVDLEFPPLIDMAAPRLRTYPKETVVAEKFEAIVDLGEANSRMNEPAGGIRVALDACRPGRSASSPTRLCLDAWRGGGDLHLPLLLQRPAPSPSVAA